MYVPPSQSLIIHESRYPHLLSPSTCTRTSGHNSSTQALYHHQLSEVLSLQPGPALDIADSSQRCPNPWVYWLVCLRPRKAWEPLCGCWCIEISSPLGLFNNPPAPQAGAVGWGQPGVTPRNVGWLPRRAPETPKWGLKQILLSPHSGGNPEEPPQGPEGPLAWDRTHCFSQQHFHSISVWREMSEEGKPTCWVPAYKGTMPVLSPAMAGVGSSGCGQMRQGAQAWWQRGGQEQIHAWCGAQELWGEGPGAALWWTQLLQPIPPQPHHHAPPGPALKLVLPLGKGSPVRAELSPTARSEWHSVRNSPGSSLGWTRGEAAQGRFINTWNEELHTA